MRPGRISDPNDDSINVDVPRPGVPEGVPAGGLLSSWWVRYRRGTGAIARLRRIARAVVMRLAKPHVGPDGVPRREQPCGPVPQRLDRTVDGLPKFSARQSFGPNGWPELSGCLHRSAVRCGFFGNQQGSRLLPDHVDVRMRVPPDGSRERVLSLRRVVEPNHVVGGTEGCSRAPPEAGRRPGTQRIRLAPWVRTRPELMVSPRRSTFGPAGHSRHCEWI
jgi:hypothetical protein